MTSFIFARTLPVSERFRLTVEEMLKVVIGRCAGQGTFSRRTIRVVNTEIKLIVEHVLMNSRAERARINGPDRVG